MTIGERKKRNLKIAQYLSTPLTYSQKGFPIYPTYEQASLKFGLHATHIFKIKKEYVGLDVGPERHLKEGVTDDLPHT